MHILSESFRNIEVLTMVFLILHSYYITVFNLIAEYERKKWKGSRYMKSQHPLPKCKVMHCLEPSLFRFFPNINNFGMGKMLCIYLISCKKKLLNNLIMFPCKARCHIYQTSRDINNLFHHTHLFHEEWLTKLLLVSMMITLNLVCQLIHCPRTYMLCYCTQYLPTACLMFLVYITCYSKCYMYYMFKYLVNSISPIATHIKPLRVPCMNIFELHQYI